MKTNTTRLQHALRALVLAFVTAAYPSFAQELIVNGSFEANSAGGFYVTLTSGLTGWTIGSSIDLVSHALYPPATDGTNWVDMTTDQAGTIAQTIPTTAGQSYRLSFDYGNYGAGLRYRNDALRVELLNEASVFQAINYTTPPPVGLGLSPIEWRPRVYITFTAPAAATTVRFSNPGNADGNPNSAGGVALDNVSVKASLALTQPVSAAIYQAVELRFSTTVDRIYEVQYTEDLVSPNWQPLGTPIAGTGSDVSAFDSTRERPRRFYRVLSTAP